MQFVPTIVFELSAYRASKHHRPEVVRLMHCMSKARSGKHVGRLKRAEEKVCRSKKPMTRDEYQVMSTLSPFTYISLVYSYDTRDTHTMRFRFNYVAWNMPPFTAGELSDTSAPESTLSEFLDTKA